ncbi:MAG: CHAT domain-containing protein [Nitrospira sp. CG24E]|nr:MAG: CHAT domain-containing protein [Nitrospira sp. CG24E]
MLSRTMWNEECEMKNVTIRFHIPHSTFLIWLALFLILANGLMSTGTVAAVEPSADSLMQQGLQAYQRGSFDQALATWKQAADLYERAGKIGEQSRALEQAAQASESLGQVSQALQQLELALTLAQQAGNRARIAGVMESLGRTYLAARKPDAALEYLTQALAMAQADQDRRVIAAIQNDLGITHVAQQHDADALASFLTSAQEAQAIGDRSLTVRASINAARMALKLKQPDHARNWLDLSLDALNNFEPSHDKAMNLIQVGLGYQKLRASMPAMNAPLLLRAAGVLLEAATLSQQIGNERIRSYADGYLGHLYETEHRYNESLQLTRRAVFSAQSANAPESLFRWQWQLGRLLAATGKLDEAIASYGHSTTTLRPIRVEVSSAWGNEGFAGEDSIRTLFFELADLLLQRASLTEDRQRAEQYLSRARDAIETYKAAELRDYFRDDCVDTLQARITQLDQLAAGTAVVYPIVFADRLELLVSLPNGLKRLSIPVSSATLTQEVRAFRKTVEKRTTREYLPHAQQLYAWLIRPLEPDLASFRIHTLVFIPDGPLRTVPMAALHDGEKFLIEKFAVASTPGLSLTDPKPIDREKVRLLSSGLTKAVQGFPSLPFVEEEINAIRRLYQGDQLLNAEFSTPRLQQKLQDQPYGILHIATHGWFASDTTQSYLLTYNGKLTINELDRLVGLFRYRKDPLELLTLSACQTGTGDDRSALGLAGVAIKAGARSALATLWFINDEASAALVSEFYRQLRNPALSKAQALQQAQQKLLADRVYEHPAYWSPFLLLNNWL